MNRKCRLAKEWGASPAEGVASSEGRRRREDSAVLSGGQFLL